MCALRSLRRFVWLGLFSCVLAAHAFAQQGERIKDLASIAGVRDNQLIGYGLVVGLTGTGDRVIQTPFTQQSLASMLANLGITLPQGTNTLVQNVAAVMVTADLPPFSRVGQRVDVTVSSVGNAKSLRGGTLLMTELRGADGQVYAISQGNVVVGGFGAEGQDGSSVVVNVPSAGRIPSGATVEREVPSSFATASDLRLHLHAADFTTANAVAREINRAFGEGAAEALDGGTILVTDSRILANRVAFVSALENLRVEPGMPIAKVIVSARTGTVIVGSEVRILPAAVAHGSLIVKVSEQPAVSQPSPFGQGETVVVPQSSIEITQDEARMFRLDAGVTLESLVQAINQIGAAPGDLVAILEALKRAGALRAELEII